MNVNILCECRDAACHRSVHMPSTEADEHYGRDLVLIVDGCTAGAGPGAVLLGQKHGYAIYRLPEPAPKPKPGGREKRSAKQQPIRKGPLS